MELTITDNMSERIWAVADDERAAIFMDVKETQIKGAILLNKREATELHQFLGEWLRGE